MRVSFPAARLLALESRALLRAVVPSRALRRALAVAALLWVTAGTVGVVTAALRRPSDRPIDRIPLVAMFLGTALVVATSTAARLLERPDRGVLFRLAPIPPSWSVALPLGAASAIALSINLVIGLPVVIAASMTSAAQAVVLTLAAVVVTGWMMTLTLVAFALVAARGGTDRAARFGRLAVSPLVVATLVLIRAAAALADRLDGPTLTVVLLASAALLPAAFRGAASFWLAAVAIATPGRRSPSPRWGSPMWLRMLRRTPFFWSMLGLVPVMAIRSDTATSVLPIVAVILPLSAMFHLVKWEDDCPDRQQLAPRAAALRLDLWLRVGMPASAVSTVAGFLLIADGAALSAVIAAAWIAPLLFLLTSAKLRAGLQIAVILSALAVVFGHARAGAQVRDTSAAPRPATAIVRGRVLAANGGPPLARSRVRLVSTADRQSISIATDALGRFEFQHVRPGRYVLTAAKGGYVPTQFGQRRAFSAGTTIDVAAHQVLERVDVHLAAGATIDGRVFDEAGEPVVDAVVMTLRSQYAGGRKRLVPAGRVLTTNEKGEFHLFGLPAGTYYLSATMMTGQNAGDGAGREGYAPTYYPGSLDIGLAETIVLDEGQQRVAADVVLSLVKTASVTGIARDADGVAFPGGAISVVSLTSGYPLPVAAGSILADGTFRVTNVPPGQFTLVASTIAAPGGSRYTASQTVAINGEDIANLVLSAPRPAAISGTVMVEAMDRDSLPANAQLRFVGVEPIDDLSDNGTIARVDAGGGFNAMVRPGAVRIELANAPGWFLNRVLDDERDVTDHGIALDPSEANERVRVFVTKHATQVTGTVVDGSASVRDYTVALFAKDPALWTFRSRYVAAARPDQQGRFSIRGVPPGEYLIAAIDHVEQGEGRDPDFLDAIRGSANSLTLAPVESRTVTLPLTRRP